MQVLFRIFPKKAAITELLDLFDVYTPDDYRSDEQKNQLVLLLAEQDDPCILPKLVPFLLDHSDDVRSQVLEVFHARAREGLEQAMNETVRSTFAELLRGPATSPRIARKAAEIAMALEWSLPGNGELNSAIADEFFIDKKGYLRRKVQPTHSMTLKT